MAAPIINNMLSSDYKVLEFKKWYFYFYKPRKRLMKRTFLTRVFVGRKMSHFVSIVNPCTGKMDWKLQDDRYDYHQEIARSELFSIMDIKLIPFLHILHIMHVDGIYHLRNANGKIV